MKKLKKKKIKARKEGTHIFMDYIKLHEVKNLFKKHWLEKTILDLEANCPEIMNSDETVMFQSIMKHFTDKLDHVNNHLK